ncbi:PD-(D/E)XK nuclease superfamily protein [Syntrophus gentianae]|uniref:PD-(D/E)XK nuclease superfamily protein n=1 Tax=Syntrophus gentianae TaxID=43775 RepID=A0A1H8AZG7_9BACT|nr:PD-(D/E)XK nuclease family protein [Syntrophus gentianae]SEM74897.1 PD-(D/E)XK nuclease superfamily protein [Syntrophus gentianae]
MVLTRKSDREIVPQYSLTGDLLSFLRCGLQYRYLNGSSLPPSRPVQLWFGEFIHGIMESAFRIWSAAAQPPAFPWPCNPTTPHQQAPIGRTHYDIGSIGDIVEATLRAQGKNPRSYDVRDNAYIRASRAVNELGPYLFPLISTAEEKVIGTRSIPQTQQRQIIRRAALYELHGIIDVLTNVQLNATTTTNVIRQKIQTVCPDLTGNFEVIVDYKGSRRPAMNHSYWQQHDWQVQTYAWLRGRQPNSLAVAAGVLLYVNELAPVQEDLMELKKAMRTGNTDAVPINGSPDAYMLSTWQPGNEIPQFSLQFRLARAIRVIPVSMSSQTEAVNNFDDVVSNIELCVAAEATTGTIMQHWQSRGDAESCAACDFRYFCTDPYPHLGNHVVTAPHAP